ncbi:hypothetical protein DL93DRAFT_2074578 [Clavulina sp. PMI_390]|nr:hypothetical protein DL93DRAFT_2074578 [Clavulina sp. PMI_390]
MCAVISRYPADAAAKLNLLPIRGKTNRAFTSSCREKEEALYTYVSGENWFSAGRGAVRVGCGDCLCYNVVRTAIANPCNL